MKQITITLPDADAGRFVAQLMDMNVTFTVQTTVARDPLVFAALEAPRPYPEAQMAAPDREPADPNHEKDPAFIERGLKGAKTGAPTYTRRDRPHRKVQRLTPEGFTSMQVVEAEIAQFGGRRFHIHEILALSEHSGFQPDTLKNQLQILVARGKLVALGKWTRQAVPEEARKRASPLPSASQGELPLTEKEPTASPNEDDKPAEFVSGEGWREPAIQ